MERARDSEYAKRVIDLIREELALTYPFLTTAIYALRPQESSENGVVYGIGREGGTFLYDPKVLIRDFAEGKDLAVLFLHSVLHCVFLHPFLADYHRYKELWDLSCDICILDIISSIGGSRIISEDDSKAVTILSKLRKEVTVLNAELIYARMEMGAVSPEWFSVDEHALWYFQKARRDKEKTGLDDVCESCSEETANDVLHGMLGKPKSSFNHPAEQSARSESMKKWEKIAGEIELSLKRQIRSAGERGDFAGYLIEVLSSIERKHTDYGTFLKNFGALEEIPRLDPDSFDFSLYYYGLELYGDMPVIEPLEYCEHRTVREFAVAIDTSLSCSMELIRSFLEKTYDILFSSMAYGECKKLVIFQCDCELKSETVISDRQELMKYMSMVSVQGRGGTDFRPVFRRIEELRDKKFFSALRGLLYFTDGDGIYPQIPPDYKTAFVMPYGGHFAKVPQWAMKVSS